MSDKELLKRIDELERKVRDLEARPYLLPIVVQPVQIPAYQPCPVWPAYPTYPYQPVWCGPGGTTPTIT